MRICLIRHGETDWNVRGIIQGLTDTELNERGVKQAQKCAEYLSNEKWDAVISSPLNRAKQTAKIIADQLDMKVQIMEEFIEKDYGRLAGLSLQQQVQLNTDKQTAVTRKHIFCGLEHLQLNKNRAKILLITHGDVIQLILSTLFSDGIFNSLVKNASLTEIEYQDDIWKVKSFNQTNHL